MKTAERAWTVADVMVEDVVTAEPRTPYKVLVEKLWLQRISGRAGQGGRSDRRRPADVTRSAGDMSAPCPKRARRAHPALITALRRPEPSRQVLRAQPKSPPSRRPTRS